MEHQDTKFLRALAIILIINSHLDRYYPIPYIGTGGAIGNSIFFFLSSYGLYVSMQENKISFSAWYANRIGRIYPSLWIVLALMYMPFLIWQGQLHYNTFMTFLGYFFNSPFWFLQYLLIYYLLAFPLFKNLLKINLLSLLTLLSIIYFIFYFTLIDLTKWSVENSPFDLIHYFMIYIFGIYISKKNIKYAGIRDYIFLFAVIALFYTHKFLMLKGLLLELQFLQQASMYLIVYYFLKIVRNQILMPKLMKSISFSRIVSFLSNHTLEIYMVHQTISAPVLAMNMPFPVNLIVFLLLTFIISGVVKRMADTMRNCIFNKDIYQASIS